jgi:DNA-binding NtrC family response regulator
VIVATNQDIAQLIHTGAFRKDLYYRLRAHHLHLPPLRERPEDLPLLTNHFLEKAAQALNKPTPTPPMELYRLLKTHAFTGNVRELEAMIFDAVAQHQGGILSLKRFKAVIPYGQTALPDRLRPAAGLEHLAALFSERLPTLKEIEAVLITEALERADGNQGIAAGMLGLTRQALNKRLIRRKALDMPRLPRET